MADWTFRRGVPEDADQLTSLLPIESGRPVEVVAAEFREDLARGLEVGQPYYLFAVIGAGGREQQIIGYSMAKQFEPPPDHSDVCAPGGWYLMGVFVADAYRRQGVARALTERRLQWMRGQADHAYYFTSPDNLRSVALHEAYGFELVRSGVEVPGPRLIEGQNLYRMTL